MKDITLEELLEAGCHFGHQVTRSNPKARDFVFEARDNIQIIDLAKTKEGLDEAAAFVKKVAQDGGNILVVATKRQAQPIVIEELERVREVLKPTQTDSKESIFAITDKWIGGILTNFTEVSKNFKKLKDLTDLLNSATERAKYTKKELGLFDKERLRLESLYSGISKMEQKPDVMFIIDSHMEYLAVREATSVGVPTVAIVDTNADPTVINYPIPANDDAVGSIRLIAGHILDAWVEGKKEKKEEPKKEEKVEKKAETKKEVKEEKTAKKAAKTKEVKEKKVKKETK